MFASLAALTPAPLPITVEKYYSTLTDEDKAIYDERLKWQPPEDLLASCDKNVTNVWTSCPELVKEATEKGVIHDQRWLNDVELGREYKNAHGILYAAGGKHENCNAHLEEAVETQFDIVPWPPICPVLAYKSAIQRFWISGREDLARELIDHTRSMRDANNRSIAYWSSNYLETPTYSHPWWKSTLAKGVSQVSPILEEKAGYTTCLEFPLALAMLEKRDTIVEEIIKIENSGMVSAGYDFLGSKNWGAVFLYDRKTAWNEEICEKYMPTACEVLKEHFFDPRAGEHIRWGQEVVLLRTSEGSTVAEHSGSMQGMANLHFTYTHATAGKMKVGLTTRYMDDAVCFFDSVRHSYDFYFSLKSKLNHLNVQGQFFISRVINHV